MPSAPAARYVSASSDRLPEPVAWLSHLEQVGVGAGVDEQRHTRLVGCATDGSKALSLLVTVPQRRPAGVLQVDPDRASGEDRLHGGSDLLRVGAVPGLEVGADRLLHQRRDPRDQVGGEPPVQLLTVWHPEAPGSTGAGGRDRLCAGVADQDCRSDVPGVGQNEHSIGVQGVEGARLFGLHGASGGMCR